MCGILGYVSHGLQQNAAAVLIRGLQAARCPACERGSHFGLFAFDAEQYPIFRLNGVGCPNDEVVTGLPHTVAGIAVIVANDAPVPHAICTDVRDAERIWLAAAGSGRVGTIFGAPTRHAAVELGAETLLPEHFFNGSFERERRAIRRLLPPVTAIAYSTLAPFQLTVLANGAPLYLDPGGRGEAFVASSWAGLRAVTDRFTTIGERTPTSGTLCGCGLHLIDDDGTPTPYDVHSIEAMEALTQAPIA